MFWKRKPPVTLTADVYARWLRALRPPWDWFLRITELEQEQLATLGDAFHAQLAELVAETMRGPKSDASTDLQREEEMAKQLAANLIRKLGTDPKPATSESMAGIGARKTVTTGSQSSRISSLFGRSPDKEHA